MAALCEANEERPGSRDHASDSHVHCRRPLDWLIHKHTHTQRYTHLDRDIEAHPGVQGEAGLS